MRRRMILVVAILWAGVTAASVALPGRTLACSCAPPTSLADLVRDEPDLVLVTGLVSRTADGRFAFDVERWYRGDAGIRRLELIGAEIDLGDGRIDVDTCGRMFVPGERMILTGTVGASGILETGICLPGGVLGRPDGDALRAEAQALLGSGATPGPPIDILGEPAPESGVAAAIPLALGALGLLALVVVLAILVARRYRQEGS
jgi:hypothetical protein